jgi:hypothetical protein
MSSLKRGARCTPGVGPWPCDDPEKHAAAAHLGWLRRLRGRIRGEQDPGRRAELRARADYNKAAQGEARAQKAYRLKAQRATEGYHEALRKESERDERKQRAALMKQLRQGGIRESVTRLGTRTTHGEYQSLPRHLRKQTTGRYTIDTAREAVMEQAPHLNLDTERDFLDWLERDERRQRDQATLRLKRRHAAQERRAA